MLKSFAIVTLCAGVSSLAAQTVQMTGRVLEKAAMKPVAGATVRLKGTNLVTTTDTAGRYVLAGNPVSLRPAQLRWDAPLIERGRLRVNTLAPGVVVRAELFDSQGRALDQAVHRLAGVGTYSLPLPSKAPRNALLFLKVRAADETYRFRVAHAGGAIIATHTATIPGEKADAKVGAKAAEKKTLAPLARVAAPGDSIEVSIPGLIAQRLATPSNGEQAEVVLDYPARASIGVGAPRPYGAVVLFDGTQGPAAGLAEMHAKWVDWRDWPNGCQANSAGSTKNTSPAQFKIARDPEFPNDTNRVTLRSHFATGTANRWGCDDIEARPELYAHGDVQIHVEWMAMGRYDSSDAENPDASTNYGTSTSASYYVNSGVYVQNRYEIQIQSAPFTGNITDCHYMGSVVNEYAPSATSGLGSGNTCSGTGVTQSPCPGCAASNQQKHNGVWQSYDITFRTSRWDGTTKTADGYLTMWWNGQLVHHNRRVTGLATGIANTSGEAIDNKLYGLKLQREAGDVRFRNIWMKHLKIDSTNTAFGY